jgi:AcrR family transcriptional regulator
MLPAVSSPAQRVDLRRSRGRATKELILDAAREVIREHGYAAATTRAVADAAGVQLSLVHYHFGGKSRLLTAVLEHENERLLERQDALYAGSEPLAEKWLRACEYLREDLRSGYVRVLWELWAAGLAEPGLAARWRAAVLGWIDLLERVAADWSRVEGVDLPVAPRAVATLVANLFLGAEAQILAGFEEADVPTFASLESCAGLIARSERDGHDSRLP